MHECRSVTFSWGFFSTGFRAERATFLQVDYDEIRRIIREEVSNAAGFMRRLNQQQEGGAGTGDTVKGVLKGVRHVGDEEDEGADYDGRDDREGEDEDEDELGEGAEEFAPPEVGLLACLVSVRDTGHVTGMRKQACRMPACASVTRWFVCGRETL